MRTDRTADVAVSVATRRLGALAGAVEELPTSRGWVPDQSDVLGADPDSPAPRVAVAWLDRLVAAARESLPPPSAGAVLALAAVTVVCLAVTAWVVLHPMRQAGPSGTAAPARAPTIPKPAVASIVVDVGGRVHHPGLETLPAGSRVADALRAAGGPLRAADIVTLDLAARVVDGQLLLVGIASGGTGPPGSVNGSGPLDLNTATAEQLDALPGVGPVLAQHIVAWRDAHGGFTSVEQLREVSGVGPRKYDELAALVTV